MPTTNRPHFTLSPLLWISIAFAIGIVSATAWQVSLEWLVSITSVFALTAFLSRRSPASTFFVIAAFFVLGAACYDVEISSVSPTRLSRMYDDGRLISGDPIEVEGSVIGMPEPAPDGYFIILEAAKLLGQKSDTAVSGRLRLFAPLRTPEAAADFKTLTLGHGTRIRVACRAEREERFLNPGVTSSVELLDRRGIDATATIKSPLLIEKVGRDAVFVPLSWVYVKRASLIESIQKQFDPSSAGVLIASMLGDQYFLDRETADIFREGGTFHVLVISGLHITFIGGLILLLARQFTRRRKLQAIVAVASLWLYGIAVGGEPPVLRACVMFTVLMFGYVLYRTSSLLNALGASALVLLVWRPSDLFDPSFQLTFLSMTAIVAFGLPLVEKVKAIGTWTPTSARPFPPNVPNWLRRFCETMYWREAAWNIERDRQIWSARLIKTPYSGRLDEVGIRRIITFIFEGLIISIAVQIWLFPLLVYYFHRVSVASILLNLWVGAVLTAESIAALVTVTLGSLTSILAIPFKTLTEVLNWLLVSVPSVITDSHWTSFRVPIYSGPFRLIYFLYFVPVIIASWLMVRWDPFTVQKRKQTLGGVVAALLIVMLSSVILLHPFSVKAPDGKLHVDFLDVGQGDAALITFPNGETMLVDGGGRQSYNDEAETEFEPDVPRIGESVVSEVLWERGLSRIDHIVATHADADHIQGLVDVSKNFSIGSGYFGVLQADPDLNQLLSVWNQKQVPTTRVASGDRFNIGGVWIEVLNPPLGTMNSVSANNGSVVLRVIFGETEILLTGDIERVAEEAILAQRLSLESDVVKVPHHGSRTSSTEGFVRAVSPALAIISVGRRSTFGHPHKEVVEGWSASGANVMTTGERGMISISTDGKKVSVEQFVR